MAYTHPMIRPNKSRGRVKTPRQRAGGRLGGWKVYSCGVDRWSETDGVTRGGVSSQSYRWPLTTFFEGRRCRRVHFAIHHKPGFTGGLERRFSRSEEHTSEL